MTLNYMNDTGYLIERVSEIYDTVKELIEENRFKEARQMLHSADTIVTVLDSRLESMSPVRKSELTLADMFSHPCEQCGQPWNSCGCDPNEDDDASW